MGNSIIDEMAMYYNHLQLFSLILIQQLSMYTVAVLAAMMILEHRYVICMFTY